MKHGGLITKKVSRHFVLLRPSHSVRMPLVPECSELSLTVAKYVTSTIQEQKRYFILKGTTLTWQEQPGTSADKSSCLEINKETLVYFVDSPRFEFEIANFTATKCSHAADKPYRLGADSREERDMWVSARRHVSVCFRN